MLCAPREQSPYVSGRDAARGDRLLRPGGLELTARAVAFAGIGAGMTVLDLGCGSGDSVRYLRTLGIDAIGIDCEPGIEMALDPGLSSWTHIVASAENLPFPDCSVDGVLAECSVSLIEDQDAVLAECARVLKDQGRLTITDLFARQPDAIARVRALKRSCASGMIVRAELEEKMARCGFTIDLWEDHSQALRESSACFIFEHGSLEGLWKCDSETGSTEDISSAMRAVRAGYFLLIATRNRRSTQQKGSGHE
jgi:ubiquinone/menaquinone biosynthesis C-methylase UbiE